MRVIGLLSTGLPESCCDSFGVCVCICGGGVGVRIKIFAGAGIGNLIEIELFLYTRLIVEFAMDFVIRLQTPKHYVHIL